MSNSTLILILIALGIIQAIGFVLVWISIGKGVGKVLNEVLKDETNKG